MDRIGACIFDLDGVVVDSAKYHYASWKKLANELGFDFTLDQNEQLKGVSRMKSLDILLEIGQQTFDDQAKLELAEKKNHWYKELINTMRPEEVLPGSRELFGELKDHGIPCALGSASKNAHAILERTDLLQHFDVVIDGNLIAKAKPDPEIFLKGAQALGVDPELCIVFEDAIAGVEAALNGNMRAIGIGSPQVLEKADYVVPSLAEINLAKLYEIYSIPIRS